MLVEIASSLLFGCPGDFGSPQKSLSPGSFLFGNFFYRYRHFFI